MRGAASGRRSAAPAVIAGVLLLLCLLPGSQASPEERRLLQHLLEDYNVMERPVAEDSAAVNLTVGITLLQIIQLDAAEQALDINAWLKLYWNDQNLKWNASEFGGISDLKVPNGKIWRPDVMLYNSVAERFGTTFDTMAVVSSNGKVIYVPPGIFRSACEVDLTWFPFDQQKCQLKLGSWTHSGYEIDLQLASDQGADLSQYIPSKQWELTGTSAERHEKYYECCPDPYVDVTFELVMRRRPAYYLYNWFLPFMIIAFLSVLGFALPPECKEKLYLGTVSLLSLIIFVTIAGSSVGVTILSAPIVGCYFTWMMLAMAASVLSTVMVLNLHHRSTKMPELPRRMFLGWLPKLLRMTPPSWNMEYKEPPAYLSGAPMEKKPDQQLSALLDELKVVSGRTRREEQAQESVSEWQFAARVVDRLCLLLLCLLMAAATAMLLLSVPLAA